MDSSSREVRTGYRQYKNWRSTRMKRVNNLYEKIIDLNNIEKAKENVTNNEEASI